MWEREPGHPHSPGADKEAGMVSDKGFGRCFGCGRQGVELNLPDCICDSCARIGTELSAAAAGRAPRPGSPLHPAAA